MATERIFTRDFMLDMFLTLFCSLNYFALLINIVDFSDDVFHASSAESGFAVGIYVIGGLLARLFIGKYVELVGRKRMLIIGVVFAVLMSAAYFAVSSIEVLYVVRFLHGMSYGITSTCTGDIVSKLLPPSRRGEGLGYYGLAFTASSAVGPLLGMKMGATGNWDLVFGVGVLLYVLALVCAVFIHVPEEDLTEEQVKQARSFDLNNLLQVSALPLAVTAMVFYFSYSGVLSFMSSYSAEIGLTEAATYFFVIFSVATLISRLTTGRIYDSRGANIVMIPAFVSVFGGMVVFSQTSNPYGFLGSAFFMGYGVSIVFSICQAIVVAESPAHRYGVTTSTFSAMNDLGTGLGPTFLGAVLPLLGFRSMYLMCAFISLISLVLYWSIHGHRELKGSS